MIKRIKDKKAITLIALVITIVVLIILAAVAINLSLGNNGIFNRAKTAKEMYQNAESYEEKEIGKITNKIDNYTSFSRNNSSVEIISAKSPSSTNTWTKVADYPSGFNYDNCYISAACIVNDNRKYMLPAGDANQWIVNVSTTSSGIEMYLRYNSSFADKDVKIVLTRYN